MGGKLQKLKAGCCTLHAGHWTLNAGRCILDTARWLLDAAHRMLHTGCWMLLFLYCSFNVGAEEYTRYVDPWIGSGGHGHVFVGANVPFGMVQVGPQNINKGWDWCSGYHYSDSVVIGFSHTHLSGTGCGDLGDVLLMPFMGEERTRRGEQQDIAGSCASYYRHAQEEVAPGYYALLMDNGIRVELTASERVACHEYIFPEPEGRKILINLKEGNSDIVMESSLRKIDDYTVEGYRFSRGWSRHKIFFVLQCSEPIVDLLVYEDDEPQGRDSLKGKGVKGVIVLPDGKRKKGQSVKLKIALSPVSCRNAMLNLQQEVAHWDFRQVRETAREKWNKVLGQVQITTSDEVARKIFYTALYHAYMAPTLYADVNGEFRGHDDRIYTAGNWTNYSTFSLWDTYRAWSPLMTILQPQRMSDFVNSMLSIHDQQGRLPIWPLVGGETDCMPGYSAVPMIADIYLKGIGGFDAERALAAMKNSAVNPRHKGIDELLEKSFISTRVKEGTSAALEYAVGDWGIAQMARAMGQEDYWEFFRRGHYYRNYFDPAIGFIRPKSPDGSWMSPYDPFLAAHMEGTFCEGTGWQYTFFVPQHPEGLIELFGGEHIFIEKLDSLFIVEGDMGEKASADISGLIGQYAHGNEPSHHVLYLYIYAGQPWKAAPLVRQICRDFYHDAPDGLIGNEDCGQMSAWYILSSLGFYQVNPSNGVYVFGSPLFDRAEIALPGGKTFTIETMHNSAENIYIQSVELNGISYAQSYIRYEDIMQGGVLRFVMGPQPNKEFGKAAENRPYSVERVDSVFSLGNSIMQ